MDVQTIIIFVLIPLILGQAGWVGRLQAKLTDLRVEVARDYVATTVFEKRMDQIDAKLDKLSSDIHASHTQ